MNIFIKSFIIKMKQQCVYVLLVLITLTFVQDTLSKKSHKRKALKKNIFDSAFEQSFLEKPAPAKKTVVPPPPPYNPDRILQLKEKIDVKIADWLKISSALFKNAKLFPPLILANGREVKIQVDDSYYRINEYYNPKVKTGPPSNLDFWFRLSGRNIFYSFNKEDMNILGSISVKSVRDVIPMKGYSPEPTCFVVKDMDNNEWKLCAHDFKVKSNWVCDIQAMLGIAPDDCKRKILQDSEVTVLTKKITQPIILITQPQRYCNENWDYSQHGDNWECTCKEGKEQSPVDLPVKEKATRSPAKPLFSYEELPIKNAVTTADGRMKMEDLKIKLVDGVIKISQKGFGKIVTLNGVVYEAEDIIFHNPAEHTINGKKFPLEMQIIHYGTGKELAQQVILCFLFEKKPGSYNKFFDDMDYFNLPNPQIKEKNIVNPLYIPKIFYPSDSEDLPVFKPFSFYTYQGSLTQPPCTERTIIYVTADPIPVSSTVITLFQESSRIPDSMDADGNVIVNSIGPQNNRSVQKLHGRPVYFYDHIEINGPEPPLRTKAPVNGHYEKVIKSHTEYFYVNSQKPSGLAGSFVVSEKEAKGL